LGLASVVVSVVVGVVVVSAVVVESSVDEEPPSVADTTAAPKPSRATVAAMIQNFLMSSLLSCHVLPFGCDESSRRTNSIGTGPQEAVQAHVRKRQETVKPW
jgi:hypothetical protein